jgi:HAD superfamily hydrolase (TIGR01509 family)
MEVMIKAVIFDCFGVLTTEGFGLFRDKYLQDLNKRKQANDSMDKLNAGQSTYDVFVGALAKLAGVSEATVSSYLDENKPNEPLFDYIRKDLKPHYKIGMLSNAGNDWLKEMFAQKDIELFDDIILSYKFSMIKPQPEIYDLAIKRLGVANQECIFVDDQEKHCEGARQAGILAIRYHNFEQIYSDLKAHLSTGADN